MSVMCACVRDTFVSVRDRLTKRTLLSIHSPQVTHKNMDDYLEEFLFTKSKLTQEYTTLVI